MHQGYRIRRRAEVVATTVRYFFPFIRPWLG